MKKLLLALVVLVAVFAGIWYALSRVDWIKLFKLEQATEKTEKKLGDLLWETYSRNETEVEDPLVRKSVDSLVTRICKANGIDRNSIQLHVFEKSEVNAFAFPGGHLTVFTGLIRDMENPEELTGVISHEIAHIRLKHVMKKLTKEIGLSVLISIATGTGDGAVIGEIIKMLSSTAFDRRLEKQADLAAIDYMVKANVDPLPLADFMERLADKEEAKADEYLSWMSTHPESGARAVYIREYAGKKVSDPDPVLSAGTWKKIRESVK